MTKLVIFDLDGTLLDTLEDLAISTNHALAQNGFPQHDTEAYRFFVGNGITKLMERALPEDQRNEKTVLRVRQDFVDYYSMHNMDYTKPYPGIPELIDDLQKQGLRMAVASNKYQAAAIFLQAPSPPCTANVKRSLPNPIQRSSGTSLRKPVPRRQIPCMSEIAASICARQPIAGSGQ